MTQVVAAIFALITAIIAVQTGFWYKLLDWIKEFVRDDIASAIWALAPQGLADFFQSIDTQAVGNMVSDVTWFIPFWSIAAIYFHGLAIAGSVLLVRYIVGWIPTIEG